MSEKNLTFNFLSKRNINFLILFIFLVATNYFAPVIVRYSVFLSLIILFYRSNDDPFWISTFFVLAWAPGLLFNMADPAHNLNFIVIPGFGREITYFEYFIVAAFVKVQFKSSNKSPVRYPKIIYLILIFTAFLFLLSFVFGVSGIKILRSIRLLLPYLLLFALPKLIQSEEKYLEMFNFFVSFAMIVFVLQVFVLITGQHIMTPLGGSIVRFEEVVEYQYEVNTELIRPNYSTHVLIMGLVFLAFLLLKKESSKNISVNYAKIFFLLILLSISLTGTRGYIIFAIIIIIGFWLIMNDKTMGLMRGFALLIPIVILIAFFPTFGVQINLAFERFATVFLFVEGDITAGGTLQRISYYVPLIEQGISKSPIFGLGFSDEYFSYTNAHVGNHNLILNGGYVGLFIFIILLFNFASIPLKIYQNTGDKAYLILIAALFAFFIVHSTSFAIFAFAVGQANYSVFFLFLGYLVLLKNKHGV